MNDLYNKILELCETRSVKPGKMCAETGLSRGMISDLKMGRTKELSAKNTKIIADYFGVSVDYLLGSEQEKKPLINGDEELTEYLDELRSRPEKRMLFSVTKNATKAQIEAIVKMIEEMKGD